MENIKIDTDIISEIKNVILERFKRIITPQITDIQIINKVNRKGENYFEIESNLFQTYPVIFKNVQIYGTGTPYKEENKIFISFYFRYGFDYYGGGSNGVELGQMIFKLSENTIKVYKDLTFKF